MTAVVIGRLTHMPSYKKEGIKTKRIGVVLPEAVGSNLERVAKNKGWSVSQTAAYAIEQWLEQLEVPNNHE